MLLSQLKEGDALLDFVGPLGKATAVSYTHLDVYKRQLYILSMQGRLTLHVRRLVHIS